MPRPPPLPERLRYLQPFRRKFARRAPEALNEDTGGRALMPLLAKRIQDLPIGQAATLLSDDYTALEHWLASLDGKNDPLHFALGFFITAAPDELAKLIKEEAERPPEPTLSLHVDLPPGAKLRRVEGADDSGKLVILKGLWLAITAVTEEVLNNLTDALPHDPGQVAETNVRFGQVTGRKFLFRGETWRGPFKKIAYALNVPGGYVDASITAIGKNVDETNWDESPFETSFATLRVETIPPRTQNS